MSNWMPTTLKGFGEVNGRSATTKYTKHTKEVGRIRQPRMTRITPIRGESMVNTEAQREQRSVAALKLSLSVLCASVFGVAPIPALFKYKRQKLSKVEAHFILKDPLACFASDFLQRTCD